MGPMLDNGNYVCEFLEGATGEWSDLEQLPLEDQLEVALTYEQARHLFLRWAAASLAIDCMNWYPWSLAGDTTALSTFLQWETPSSLLGCPHTSFLGLTPVGTGKYLVPKSLVNPAAATTFARFELFAQMKATCPGWGPSPGATKVISNQTEAVRMLVEWFHGPQNAYTPCDALACATVCSPPGGWTEEALNQCPPGVQPFPLLGCPQDGTQAWIHLHGGPGDPVQAWYSNQVAGNLGVPVQSFGYLKKVKQGGCGQASSFFVAVAAGMNIPALYGFTLLLVTYGCPSATEIAYALGHNYTVKLPTMGLALWHGDDLWGPGGSLFPGDQLFVGHDVALATAYLARLLISKGVTIEYWTPLGDGGFPKLVPVSAVAQTDAKLVQTARHTEYWVTRYLLERFLDNADKDPYVQIALDAFLYRATAKCSPPVPACLDCGSQQPEDFLGVFGALKSWMVKTCNPHTYPLIKVASVYPSVYRADWGVSPPTTVWEEQAVQGRLYELIAAFGLDKTSYNNPAGSKNNLLFRNLV